MRPGSIEENIMRIPGILKLFVLGASLLLAGAATSAAPTQIINGAGYRVPLADYGNFEGEYTLSNGSLLVVTARGRRWYAAIDDAAAKEIVATGPHDFVAADASIRIAFDRYEDGLAPGLTLTMRRRR